MPDSPANKGAICRRYGWSRYQFDQMVAEGMPYVVAAAHRGAEWSVDPQAVERWLRARAARAAAEERRRRERDAARRAEAERQAAARWEAEERRHRQECEAARRAREAADRRCEDERRARALQDCYSACFRLAFVAYGVTTGPGWPSRPENQRFLADWPNRALGGPPAWWRAPPNMLEFALAERRRDKRYGEPEPDWGRFLEGYKFDAPWPWRVEPGDA
jgi:hypothetical protein